MFLKNRIFLIVLVLFVSSLATVSAGSLLIGVKGWGALWNPVSGDLSEATLQDFDPDSSITLKDGRGSMFGPVLGYNFDTNPFALSAALMVFGNFKQESEYSIPSFSISESMAEELKRADIDIALSYSLDNYLKLFAGYKHTTYKVSMDFEYEIYEWEAVIKMPTAGLGYTYPVNDRFLIGLQGGLLYAIPDVTFDGEDLDTENTIGFNIEINGSYVLTPVWLIQGGYRYQKLNIDFIDYNGTDDVSSADIFNGITLSLLYVVDIE